MTRRAPASAAPPGSAQHHLARPTVLSGLRELAVVAGAAEALALWAEASRVTGRHGVDLGLEDQLVVVEHVMSRTTGAVRATAVGWATRLRLCQVLERS